MGRVQGVHSQRREGVRVTTMRGETGQLPGAGCQVPGEYTMFDMRGKQISRYRRKLPTHTLCKFSIAFCYFAFCRFNPSDSHNPWSTHALIKYHD